MSGTETSGNSVVVDTAASANKQKRVRTGCLTCRERHLKCDEGMPICHNCRKSSRACKRGVRLNFIDTKCEAPPVVPPTLEWDVSFQDESREIASEYKGGAARYPPPNKSPAMRPRDVPFEYPSSVQSAASLPQQAMEQPQSTFSESSQSIMADANQSRDASHRHEHSLSNGESAYSASQMIMSASSPFNPEQTLTPASETHSYLSTPEEVLFMQVYVEEVGLWMDSMDPLKHFSRLLPFHSLSEPMLMNAFLACGARHLTLVNPLYHEDKALHFYDTATRLLLNSLQNPNRDTVICAATAVILNVYEIMSERALQRMNHIAGARALIKECGWNARSSGIGAACFWLNVGMELLSCLHFNWQTAWNPDLWGVDMEFSRGDSSTEEKWTYRIVYIVAKIANFRATIPRFQEASPRNEAARLEARYAEWKKLKELCDSWHECVPRSMHPMAYLYPQQSNPSSHFPEVWLIKRTTIVARLFYHTAMVLLPQINPLMSKDSGEMADLLMQHSRQICGIVSQNKDRGVASVALRSLAIAAECLVVREEQEEVLEMFEKIRKDTGWRVGFINKELKEKWGWIDEEALRQQQQAAAQQQMSTSMGMQHPPPLSFAQFQSTGSSLPPAPPPASRRPGGIMNPLLATADFSGPQHPYQSFYTPPNVHHNSNHSFFS
ncbi:MAG: hypothetical protein M1829_004926 [Trizodia sp. TS-e1964]|nr:MAG: hypothetical protein M1829_004926 [Trizodia sp. TS-e1964]